MKSQCSHEICCDNGEGLKELKIVPTEKIDKCTLHPAAIVICETKRDQHPYSYYMEFQTENDDADGDAFKTVINYLEENEVNAVYKFYEPIEGIVIITESKDGETTQQGYSGETYWELIMQNPKIQQWVDDLEKVSSFDESIYAYYEKLRDELYLIDERTNDIQDWIFNNIYLPKVKA